MDRLHILETENAAILAPLHEGPHGAAVGGAGVGVADVHGEEFEEAAGGWFAGFDYQCGEMIAISISDRGQLSHAVFSVSYRANLEA
jgi:hypothetical protein